MTTPLKFENATMYRWCDTLGFHLTVYDDWWKRVIGGVPLFHGVFFEITKCDPNCTACAKSKEGNP